MLPSRELVCLLALAGCGGHLGSMEDVDSSAIEPDAGPRPSGPTPMDAEARPQHDAGPGDASIDWDYVIPLENTRRGTLDWRLDLPSAPHRIEGFASATSVDIGGSIELYVSTDAPKYTIEVFRMGWYQGLGARRVLEPVLREARKQPDCVREGPTLLYECPWIDPYTLRTIDRAEWVSGIHLAKLTALPIGMQAYIIFAVRDDARVSDYLLPQTVSTYQAYNNWGGASTYDSNSAANHAARKVSFDRPYARAFGAGDFFEYEYNMIRFLEREGRDVSYATDIDIHRDPSLLDTHRALLSVGHDEYWSWDRRQNVTRARDRGMNLGFFGSNAIYWQSRLEPSHVDGRPDRTLVAYKRNAFAEDPAYQNPLTRRHSTMRWRDPAIGLPEAALIGVMYDGIWPVSGDVVIADPSSWIFRGTSIKAHDRLVGLLGFECDSIDASSPADLMVVAHSPLGGARGFSDASVYTSSTSGAVVFAAGTERWSWGLDDFVGQNLFARSTRGPLTSTAAQAITRNILSRFTAP
jgi:hypothetical protein